MRNFHLAIIVVAFAWTNLADAKSTRTSQSLKKATAHLKPTKGPKNLLDTFKALPADDFEFIKQLDKQFNKFGDNVKIKVQKVNRTANATSKNSKRTIDRSLGYGYHHPNDQHSMFTFSKPRYEVYPYSQHDIPPAHQYHQHRHQQTQNHLNYLRHYPTALVDSDSNYYGKQAQSIHTSVEVQPSHSYEIKQTEDGYKTIYHGDGGHAQEYGQNDHAAPEAEPVPVIVLRVPGPAKYASHLQALLQQYLEARAAQYLQALQEQEVHGIDNSQQIGHLPDISAYGALPVLPYGSHQAYLPAQMYIQQYAQIQPYYGQQAIANPYASAHIAQPIEVEDESVAAAPTPINYYAAHAQSQQNDDADHTGVVHPTAYQYQNIHDEQSHQQYSSDHDANGESVYGQPQHESVSQHNELLTNENYPDDKHTRVVFKTSTEPTYTSNHYDNEQYAQPYLPQSQVSTYRAPLVYHKSEHFYNQPDDQTDGSAGYDENAQSIVSSTPYANTVAITQRPAVLPQNYHAQLAGQIGSQIAQYTNGHGYDYAGSTEASDEYVYKRNSNKKRQSIQNRDDQYKKFKNLANRMKARNSSSDSEQIQV